MKKPKKIKRPRRPVGDRIVKRVDNVVFVAFGNTPLFPDPKPAQAEKDEIRRVA